MTVFKPSCSKLPGENSPSQLQALVSLPILSLALHQIAGQITRLTQAENLARMASSQVVPKFPAQQNPTRKGRGNLPFHTQMAQASLQ